MRCAVGQTVHVPGNGPCEVLERTGKSVPFILTVRRSDGCTFDVDESVVMEPALAGGFDDAARMNLK